MCRGGAANTSSINFNMGVIRPDKSMTWDAQQSVAYIAATELKRQVRREA
jgi:hypothetical protein